MDLSVTKLMKLLSEKFLFIFLITVIFGIGAFGIFKFLIKPVYENNVSFIVSKSSGEGDMGDITYANSLVAKYVEYMTNDKYIDKLRILLNDKYTKEYIKESLTATSKEDSGSFLITISASSPEAVKEISQVIYINSKNILSEPTIFDGSFIDTISLEPDLPLYPVSPNIILNTILGVLLGLVLSFSMVVIIDRLDNTIKDEYDLIENYDIPLIGIVYTHKANKENGV